MVVIVNMNQGELDLVLGKLAYSIQDRAFLALTRPTRDVEDQPERGSFMQLLESGDLFDRASDRVFEGSLVVRGIRIRGAVVVEILTIRPEHCCEAYCLFSISKPGS